jgi:hypothetical protein
MVALLFSFARFITGYPFCHSLRRLGPGRHAYSLRELVTYNKRVSTSPQPDLAEAPDADPMSHLGPIYTIGHSTLPLDTFVATLHDIGALTLADIRTVPRSRTNPQYNLDSLPASLAASGIRHVHLARLGGLRGRTAFTQGESPNSAWRNASFRNYSDYALTPAFREGLAELEALAAEGPVAIMCAEAVWWRCHRRIVADYLLVAGVQVLDVIPPSAPEPHILTPFAVPQADGTIRYVAQPE